MELRYLRFRLFYRLLSPFSARARGKRMDNFRRRLAIRDGMTVLDLGGQPAIWCSVEPRLSITILNLAGVAEMSLPTHHAIDYAVGDACCAPEFTDKSFDVVFSNSVIEHVGDAGKRSLFAAEVRRLGRAYWVQTPSKYFPIEAHCGMPLWWFYPKRLRRFFIERWRSKLPAWTEMVESTDVVTRQELERLFPDASIIVERVLGLPKSYVAYRPAVASPS
jgi:hypothetical protein